MNTTFFSVVASTYLLASSTLTYASCSTPFTEKFAGAERIVDSLRPEKPGQMRVFAADGSEFNAGQASWMKARLRKYAQLCAHGSPEDLAEAAKILAEVQDLLKSHQRQS
jgi:hypothetical protein